MVASPTAPSSRNSGYRSQDLRARGLLFASVAAPLDSTASYAPVERFAASLNAPVDQIIAIPRPAPALTRQSPLSSPSPVANILERFTSPNAPRDKLAALPLTGVLSSPTCNRTGSSKESSPRPRSSLTSVSIRTAWTTSRSSPTTTSKILTRSSGPSRLPN
jgi:hypothetical protein